MLNKILTKVSENKYYQYIYFVAAFLLLLVATIYFFPISIGDDLNFHAIRLDALADAIRDGSFPVYTDYKAIDGYGYATKWFYCDLMLIPFAYIASYSDLLSGYKILVIFYTVLCGILSYVSMNKVYKNRYIAFIFCILYTFSYYRFFDVYSRAALGEAICLTFIPLAFWGAYEIVKGNYKKWYVISIAFSLMIFSHVNTPPMVVYTIVIFSLFCYKSFLKEPIRLAYLALAAFVTILATAYFLFPFVEQFLSNDFYFALKNERAITFPVFHGIDIKYILRGLFSGITYVYPEIVGLGIVITVCVLFRFSIFRDKLVKEGDLFLLVSCLLLLVISKFYPWQTFPFSIVNFIQFSWRFYAVLTLTAAVAGAIYLYTALHNNKRRYIAGIPLVVALTLLVIVNGGSVYTNNRSLFETYDRSIKTYYGIMGAEYLPQNIPNVGTFFLERGSDSIRTLNAYTQISNFDRSGRILSFKVSEVGKGKLQESLELPLIYYKGYKAQIGNEEIEIKQSENGLVELPVSKTGQVKVYFGGTVIQNISPYITLLMAIFLTVYIVLFNRKNRKTNAE